MKKSAFIIIPVLLLSNYCNAQQQTWLSAEAGWRSDLYHYSDAGNALDTRPSPAFSWGFLLGQELNEHVLLESGFGIINYLETIRWKAHTGWAGSSSMSSYQIPLRLKYSIDLYADKLHLTPSIGYSLCYNRHFNPNASIHRPMSQGSGGIVSETDSVHYLSFEYANFHRLYSLVETGISLSYQAKNGLSWSLTGRYTQGFSKIIERDILYTLNDEEGYVAQASTKGSNYQVLFGVSYPISTIWQNQRERRASKPERISTIQLAQQSRFYLGMESGLTWNAFSHSHPNIRAEFDGYSESDFSWGFILGYRVHEQWYLETGYHFQSFWNRYYIQEYGDLIEGAGSRHGGDGFRQIPLKLKYKYPVANQRLALVPYLGASVITHHASQAIADTSYSGRYEIINGQEIRSDTSATYTIAYRDKKVAPQLNAGIGLEYALNPRLIFTLNANYALGLQEIYRLQVTHVQNGISQKGDIMHKGTNWNISCGVKIPLGSP